MKRVEFPIISLALGAAAMTAIRGPPALAAAPLPGAPTAIATGTSATASAEIHVSWIDHFTQPISGRTRWSRDDDWEITDANIVLAVHHSGGERLDFESMHAMALHEVGHLLGLDHTSDSLSVMAPRVRV